MGKQTKDWAVGLGVSGGIAAYKAIEVLRLLQKRQCNVRIALTAHASEFITPLSFRALTREQVIVSDYSPDNKDPIAHINFSQEIDLLLVAPATANIIAKFAAGIADDFLTSTFLASTAPVLIAPAMNTKMWFHPATQRNVERLKADGVYFVEPIAGRLACETVGTGKLEDVETIVEQALSLLDRHSQQRTGPGDLSMEKILITAGATREEIDPVRFISNYSSGRMGVALAESARDRGAEVTMVVGNISVARPNGIRIIDAASADKMYESVMNEISKATAFISSAAVADYRPVRRAKQKVKKGGETTMLELERTPDILAEVGRVRGRDLLAIGFAAETESVVENARSKLRNKKVDMIVANDVSSPGIGFGSTCNAGFIITRASADILEIPVMSKPEMADRILDEMIKLRSARNRNASGTNPN
jgi:phosphopantothenoylcysteine decarboxylase / phosphopantothenate---cysteine ligase